MSIPKSSGQTPRGILSGDVRRSAPAASTAMQRHSQSAFVAFPATLTNRASIYAWSLKNYLSRLWSSPRIVFVNSMSDLFQPGVPDAYIEDVVRVMVEANWHTYQVLTKRSERLLNLYSQNSDSQPTIVTSGGGSVSRTSGTVCHELSIFVPRHCQISIHRASRKTSGNLRSPASTGQSWAEKAA